MSLRVRQQYEDNPYPRWVHVAGNVEPVALEQYLRDIFPTVPLASLHRNDALDVLVAGAGTGWQAIGVTQKFEGARVLAVDLSLSSLSYAVRKTPAALSTRIEYAQADILKLGAIDRRFDLIEASGVLHHMADPFEGWRVLLALLKPPASCISVFTANWPAVKSWLCVPSSPSAAMGRRRPRSGAAAKS